MEPLPIEHSSLGQRPTLRWASISLATAASLGFGYLAFGELYATAILEVVSRISAWTIVGALSIFLVAVTLRIIRWWLLMRRFQPDLPLSICVSPFLLGIAANDFLPVRIGDLVKVFGNRKEIHVPASTRLGTIIMERLFDTISILLFFSLGTLHLKAPAFEKYSLAAYGVLAFAIGILLILLFCSKIAERWCHALLNLQPFRNRKLFRRAKGWTSQFFTTFTALRSKSLAGLLLLSCVIWGVEGTMALILAWAIDPMTGALGPYLSLACGALSNFLPSAPGMLGTLDYFLTLGVLGYGMDKPSAATFALLVHAMFLGFSIIVAAILLSQKNTWVMLRSFTNLNRSIEGKSLNDQSSNERTNT
ncbi:MAG: hypothetical protein CMI31_06195 [Opitutae bacterium]|nr:hypothetical protein [Opitutae bacterium]|tara:strand:+ start:1117 stop:2205 length:1089 start_codon:yes stop_codon:yes gene_type:complete